MTAVYIATGATEPIEAQILDVNGAALTGLVDIKATVRRASDGKFLDWADATFKASAWTTLKQALSQVDAVNAPGQYHYAWDTSAITNAAASDVYFVTVAQDGASSAKNVPQTGEIRVRLVDDASKARRLLQGNAVEAAGNPGTLTVLDDDDVTVLQRWALRDGTGGAVVASVGEPARRTKI